MKGKQAKPKGLHRALKLQHHRHTAKRLAHHHTSYRALFVVLAVAALSIGTIQRTVAADLSVNATVPSTGFTQSAEITSPLTGNTVTSQTLTVSGTCQVVVNSTIVAIERGGIVIGSTPCQSNGTFSVVVTLQQGPNQLLPKAYDTLNQQAPDGTVVTVFYVPPPPPTNSSGNSGGTTTPTSANPATQPATPASAPAPIVAAPAQPFWASTVGGAFELVTSILGGGGAPYAVDIDWGDGSPHDKVVVNKPGNLAKQHTYEKPGMYVIVLSITDVLGANVTVRLVAVILTAPTASVANPSSGSPGLGELLGTPEAKAIWATYLALTLVTLSLWLTNPYHIFSPQVFAPAHMAKARPTKARGRPRK